MSARKYVPLIKSYKEVKTAHRRTKTKHTSARKRALCVSCFLCCAVVARLRRCAVCYAMKEKIEMLRNLAEAILDEIAEMEVLIDEDPEVHTNGDHCADGKRCNV